MPKINLKYVDNTPILYHHTSFAKTVSIGILIKSGSITENEHQLGYAHFAEHMIFKGTNKNTYLDINKKFEKLGAYINAFTDKYYTLFYLHVVEEFHIPALKLLLEIVFESTFNTKELEKEKNVIIEEIQDYKDSPEDCLIEAFYKKTFAQSFLGNPILGSRESIETTSQKSLFDYYKTHYHLDNAVFSIAGNFDQTNIENILLNYPFPKKNTPSTNIKVPSFISHRSYSKHKTEQVYFVSALETVSNASSQKEFFVLWNMIFGDMTSSRLYTNIREEKGLCYSIDSNAYFDPYLGIISVVGSCQPKNVKTVLDEIDHELLGMLKNTPTKDELDTAIAQVCAHIAFRQESTLQLMMNQAKYWLFYQKQPNFKEIYQKYKQTTIDDLIKVSQILSSQDLKKSITILSSELSH